MINNDHNDQNYQQQKIHCDHNDQNSYGRWSTRLGGRRSSGSKTSPPRPPLLRRLLRLSRRPRLRSAGMWGARQVTWKHTEWGKVVWNVGLPPGPSRGGSGRRWSETRISDSRPMRASRNRSATILGNFYPSLLKMKNSILKRWKGLLRSLLPYPCFIN